jgi:hypothetical protein
MPEQITKHPDVTIQVLKSAGAKCGPGVDKQILKKCPGERFCALPGGEMCIYGTDQIAQMTQITPRELCPPPKAGEGLAPQAGWGDAGALGVTFALGLAVGAVTLRRRNRSRE